MDNGRHTIRKPNPSEGANFLSALTYFYALPTLLSGWKRQLNEEDLYQILQDWYSKQLGDDLENAWNEELLSTIPKKKPSLLKAIFKVFKWSYCKVAGQALLSETLYIAVAYYAAQLLKYFRSDQRDISDATAYWYTAGMILCSLVATTLSHGFMHRAYLLSMRLRVACCAVIYRKSLRLSRTTLGRRTHGGHIINMMSNDVDKFMYVCVDASYIWLGPLLCAIVGYLLYLDVGVASASGILVLLGCTPFQMALGYIASIYRRQGAKKTDARVRLINEVLSGIQVIKMCTWEDIFSKLIGKGRRDEMKRISSKFQLKGMVESSFMFNTRLSTFATILTYLLIEKTIRPEQIFIIFAYHAILRTSMTVHLPDSATGVAECNVAVKRIRDFLLLEEFHVDNGSILETRNLHIQGIGKYTKTEDPSPTIKLKNITVTWKDSTANALTDINLEVKDHRLLAVLGPIGGGKSSLLHLILKELPIDSGHMEVRGKISYASQEPWLFSGTVRQNIIFGLPMNELKYQEVVQVCALRHDLNLLPNGDLTMVGDRGFALSGGQRARINLARAIYKDADIYLLDDPLSAVDAIVGRQIFEDCIVKYLKQKIVILTTNQLQFLKDVDHIIYLKDGALKAEGTYQQLLSMNLDFKELTQTHTNEEDTEHQNTRLIQDLREEKGLEDDQNSNKNIYKSTNIDVYCNYFKAADNNCIVFLVLLLFLLAQCIASCSDYIVALWANLEQTSLESNTNDRLTYNGSTLNEPKHEHVSTNDHKQQRNLILDVYSLLTILLIVVSFVRSSTFYYMIGKISTTLHRDMFQSVLRATMKFFYEHNAGNILNRFSNDMAIVDETLPPTMMRSVQIMLAVFGVAVTIIFVNPWFLIEIVVMVIFAVFAVKIYLRTSKFVMHIERGNRSPLYGHVNATLQGLTTIRAFDREEILLKEFDTHQDLHTSAWYTFAVVTRSFGYWLDISSALFSASIILTYVLSKQETYIGNVGLALTQAISLSRMFQWAVRQSGELENQMTSTERILEYSNIANEKDPEYPQEVPDNWPSLGKIEFRNVSLFYDPEESPVLHDLNFVVQSREKIGVVGRTGAGKSSLINALFQLSHTKGHILIDDVEITNICLSDLRSNVSIIPQEPLLFSGSLRNNLDPFGKHTDTDIWSTLEDVELKDGVKELAKGLDFKISEGGSNFSVGQRQLLCLARAILCENKILILDEATANIDQQTDIFIQKTIRKKLMNCTVLTVAHRLNTIIDSDKVLVMDAGRNVEYAHPHLLLKNKSSYFYQMVSRTGNFDELYKLAENSYYHRENA